MKSLIWIVGLLILVTAGGGWYFTRSSGNKTSYRLEKVRRGELLASISATGTVEPEEVIDVGAQVAGLIEYFGKDPNHADRTIDYGTEVDKDTLLAHIDDSLYTAEVDSAQAEVESAQASVTRAQADLGQMNARLLESKNAWDRAQKIGPSDALSENDYDTYKANYDTAVANLAVGQAAVTQAQTSVAQAQSQLIKAKRNLGYCTIISPVKGVIIDRRVNIGQTVVSSLNAPSLFLIAKDLRRIQVWTSVNEADIGNVHAGQPVTFTVDAFPGHPFKGSVGKVRLNASMTQNVVTYTVEVVADNSDGKLLPYLTANVQFELEKKDNVLMVPNAALRWIPDTSKVDPEVVKAANAEIAKDAGKDTSKEGARPHNKDKEAGDDSTPQPREGGSAHDANVWVVDGNYVRPIRVQTGTTDGTNTEIIGDQLAEGTSIIVGENTPDTSGGGQPSNPFLPQFRQRRNGR